MSGQQPLNDEMDDIGADSREQTRIWHYLSAILGGFIAAGILAALLSLLDRAGLEWASPQQDWAFGIAFVAAWIILSFMFVWKAATVRRVLVRVLSVIGLEWLAAAATGMALLNYPAPSLSGLPPLIAFMASPRLFAAMLAMLGLVLGGAFLFAAFLIFRES